jgi:ppGpp synthetase/RelA/SpoT-type nucleotidyltranferase
MPNNQKQQQRNFTIPPRKSLSLGWRLTLSTALIVSLVMGAITFIQNSFELKNQRIVREHLLKESLAPLAARFELVNTIETLRSEVRQFHLSYKNKGFPDHQVVVLDKDNRVLFSTIPNYSGEAITDKLKAAMPVVLPKSITSTQHGILMVLKDASLYERSVIRQWKSWVIHMAATVIAIFIFLYPAIYYLVTNPIEKLVNEVKKMEMGYWSQTQIMSGAWEIQWLSWRFGNMVDEVRIAVTQLFNAEQRVREVIHSPEGKTNQIPSQQTLIVENDTPEHNTTPVYQDLVEKCKQLESASPDNPNDVKLAHQAWEEYTVNANRLGYKMIKARLEDAALQILNPKEFHLLDNQLSALKKSHRDWAKKCGDQLCRVLEKRMIPCIGVFHRVKHTAGVWAKMHNKGLLLNEVHDLYAFRVVVPTESDCYAALGVIHNVFKPVIGRFKDFISNPKDNGYQSLHTCVESDKGPIIEIQIRSVAMHHHSESGTAAHWVYKKIRKPPFRGTTSSSRWRKLWQIFKEKDTGKYKVGQWF